MKTFIPSIGLVTALMLALFASPLWAQDAPPSPGPTAPDQSPGSDSAVSFQTFYDQLSSQGTWVNTDPYGYVFQPTESDSNWRPYTYGHWVNTDAGLTWVSDDSFGWITDHYGRWTNIDGYGWVWVPGYTWGPAWVSWRDGGDDVGWAPLPPDSDQGIDYADETPLIADGSAYGYDYDDGYHIGDDCDTAYGIGPLWYNFCPIAFIGDRDCYRHFHDRRDNFGLIGRTHNVTNINFHRDGRGGRFGHVHADGPSVAGMNAHAHNPIEHAQLTAVSRLGAAGLHGNSLAAFAPRVDPNTFRSARPATAGRNLGDVSVNHGTNINQPLAVNSEVHPDAASAAQVHAATMAQGGFSPDARIATANTHFTHSLNHPLMRSGPRDASATGTAQRENGFTGNARATASPVSADSRFTGGTAMPRADTSPGEGRFTAGEQIPRPTMSSSAESRFAGEGFRPASIYRPSSSSIYHAQGGGSMFRSGGSAYHPQSSFHSFAPQSHFSGGGGGGFHAAPAAHFSGGGGFHGGGGGFHGGGGGGGGHAGGGGGGHR